MTPRIAAPVLGFLTMIALIVGTMLFETGHRHAEEGHAPVSSVVPRDHASQSGTPCHPVLRCQALSSEEAAVQMDRPLRIGRIDPAPHPVLSSGLALRIPFPPPRSLV